MSKRRRRTTQSALRRKTIERLARQLQLALLVLAMLAIGITAFALWRREQTQASAGPPPTAAANTEQPTLALTPRPSPTPGPPTPTPMPKGKRVGILAGHYGPQNDPGAVCPDGLREVDINLTVAERVVARMQGLGYEVDLLEEYDARLNGYRADVMLSIHADACDIPEASGFKVARVSFSAIPEIEDRLVECLYEHYGFVTGLPRHDYSITPDMHGYHAFVEIDPQTPGAIIEMGFMAADRYILVRRPDLLAEGIVRGLLCFLED
jgi:N-acetylmuramoyl-L-alanine amidase